MQACHSWNYTTKRARATQEEEEEELSLAPPRRRLKAARRDKGKEKLDIEQAGPSVLPKKRRRKGKRTPTIKGKLLKKLRARKKQLRAELRQVDRDINSLVCRRKK